jgi:hypothetical protein
MSSDLNFQDFNQRNPCSGCPAPCCRVLVSTYPVPTTFMQLDYLKYALHFPGAEILVTRTGDWSIIKWGNCCEFEERTLTCKLHNTPEKPRTCVAYNPHNCWYKRIFVLNDEPEAYRLNLARFNEWIRDIRFNEDGKMTASPDFDKSLELLKTIPVEPSFKLLSDAETAADIRQA